MARHRSYSTELKHQVAQEHLGGESTNCLAPRHDVSHNLSRTGLAKYESGIFNGDFHAPDLRQQCEAMIAARERLVGPAVKRRIASFQEVPNGQCGCRRSIVRREPSPHVPAVYPAAFERRMAPPAVDEQTAPARRPYRATQRGMSFRHAL